MKDSRSIDIGREALLSLVSNVLMAVVGFAGSIVIARALGPNDLGIYRTALAGAFVFTQITGGVGTAIRKRVSEVDVSPERFLGTGIVIHAGVTVLLALCFVALETPATEYFGTVEAAYAVVVVVAGLGLFQITNRTLAGVGYPGYASWMDTIRSVVTVALQVIFLWYGFRVLGVIAGLVLATVLTAVASAFATGVRPSLPDRGTLRRVYTFARWSVPNALVSNIYSSADVLLVRYFVGSVAVGYYTVSNQLVMPAILLASSIRGPLAVRASGVSSTDGSVSGDLANSLSYTGLFAIPMFFGALAMPRALVTTVFGAEYGGAWAALIMMAAFSFVKVFALPFEATLEGIDRPETEFRVNAFMLAVHVPLAAALGSIYGLLGVIGATIVAEIARVGTYQFIIRREFGTVILPRTVAEQCFSALLMFVTLEAILAVVPVASWFHLLVTVGTGAAIYFVLLVAVSDHFRLTLHNTLPLERLGIDRR